MKLKGHVNNPDLLGIDEMFIYGEIGTTGSNQDLDLCGYTFDDGVHSFTTVEIEGATFGELNQGSIDNGAVKIDDTHVKLAGTTGLDTLIGVVGSAGTIFRLRVNGKYNLRKIGCKAGISGLFASIDDLLYSDHLRNYQLKITTTAFLNYIRGVANFNLNGFGSAAFKTQLQDLDIEAPINTVSFDLSIFSGYTALTGFSCGSLGSGVTGDIANLANSKNLYNISLENSAVNGNISSLGECTVLGFVDLAGDDISGTMEAFVQGQRNAAVNPRTTNSTGINVNTLGKYVTIGGNVPTETWQRLKWTENTITFGSITVNA